MPLPIYTSPDDAISITSFLRTRPTGSSLKEARAILDAKILDGRKLSAFAQWDLVTSDDNQLLLTQLGWQLARNPENAQSVFRSVIAAVVPYKAALEWAYHQSTPELTAVDTAAHWHQHFRVEVGDNDRTIRDAAVCFLNLADAAGFGRMLTGRRGQLTRLDLDRANIAELIETSPVSNQSQEDSESNSPTGDVPANIETGAATDDDKEVASSGAAVPTQIRVFISHGRNMEIVDQIQTMLSLADIASEVAEEEESGAIPVPEKVLTSMRRCSAGIIAVTVDEGRQDSDGNYVLNENVLIEIGAAFVLYDRKVILVWDTRLDIPSNLQGLYRCEYSGDELSWSAGMKLMKAIQGFKQSTD